ncbi:ABC transporter ATP-binding protein [Castellaniella sp. FW104-16D08]|uniref:ABC transporter ATP-binding protein n=1 Tax=unclassified Castellaniella TaxID=2617606 RepID=UPI003316099B
MLEIEDVRAGYGVINVLWDVSLSVPQGQLTTIVGPNGAGKTTLLRAIMGLIPLSHGSITFKGQPLGGTSTWDLLGRGIAMIPEGRMVFKDMSIEENLMLGAYPKSRRAGARANCEKAYALFPQLKERRTQLAGTLSGGEAQMLAMGRGLMSDPDLLIIDEPSLGLAPVIVSELFNVLTELKKEGRTIVLVEQNTHKAVGVADHVHLMQGGKIQFSQAAADVNIEALHELYFAR